MPKCKRKIAGVPMTEQQEAKVEKARREGERRVVLEGTPEQKEAIHRRATAADAEGKEIIVSFRDRPEYAVQIRRARKAAGMTLEELAGQTGMTKSALSKIECGANDNPTIATLDRIGRALGLELTVRYA
jgi:ribosome-binding protein aMBF1 (putative translation factor)